MLLLVDNPFRPGAAKISTLTRAFLVGDSDIIAAGEGGLVSVLPGMKDADKGLLCKGVDLGLGVAGAIDLTLGLLFVVIDSRHGDLGGETGEGRGASTSISSSSRFFFFVALVLCLFAGRACTEGFSSSPGSMAFALPFEDPIDMESEWDDTTLARSSPSLSPSSMVRLLRLRDTRAMELRGGAGGS